MKQLLLALALTVSAPIGQARSIMLQPIAQVNIFLSEMSKVTLYSNGMLEVETKDTQRGEAKYLSTDTFNDLKQLIYPLANSEIKESRNHVICMMAMPMPSETLLLAGLVPNVDAIQFTNKLRVILSGEGCHIAHKIYPADESSRQSARHLKQILTILAQEILNK